MIKDFFYNEKETCTFRRINESHPLDIFIGYNDKGNASILIDVKGRKYILKSSKYIEVNIYNKENNKTRISFELLDNSKETIFFKFCEDIIESTININKFKSYEFIAERWNDWKFMFKNPDGKLLSENEVKGLIGEMIFLDSYMFNRYGISKSIESWQGPDQNHKDFEIEDKWYEVKSLNTSSLTIKINSLQQLDSNLNGNLEVIFLDKTNKENLKAVNLNDYIKYISNKIEIFESYLLFHKKLNNLGYEFNEEYYKYNYKFIKRNSYLIDENFPKIKKEDLKEGIVKVSYEILMENIKELLRGDD